MHRLNHACQHAAIVCHWSDLAARGVSSTPDVRAEHSQLAHTIPVDAHNKHSGAASSRRSKGQHIDVKRIAAARALCSCDGHAVHPMAKSVSGRDGQQLVVHSGVVLLLLSANAAADGDQRLHVTSGTYQRAATSIVATPRPGLHICRYVPFTVKRMSMCHDR